MKEIKELIRTIQYILEGQDADPDFDEEVAAEATPADAAAFDEHAFTSNSLIEAHLTYIKGLLTHSIKNPEAINIATIQQTMRYIESIRVEKPSLFFFLASPNTVREKLSDEGKLVFTESKILNKLATFSEKSPIPRTSVDIFTGIHDTLFEVIRENLPLEKQSASPSPAWTYPYPKNESNHIVEPAVTAWETAHATLLPGDPAYNRDFVRDYSILNMLGKTSKGVDDLLTYLLQSTTYTNEEKGILLAWLKANGGQDNNRFIDLLLANGSYTTPHPANQFKSTGIQQNWTISDDSKIIFQLNTVLNGLVIDGDVYQINPNNGMLETVELVQDDSHNLIPCLEVRATIELDINDGRVQPRVTNLIVTSYTKSLLAPKPPTPDEQVKAELPHQ